MRPNGGTQDGFRRSRRATADRAGPACAAGALATPGGSGRDKSPRRTRAALYFGVASAYGLRLWLCGPAGAGFGVPRREG